MYAVLTVDDIGLINATQYIQKLMVLSKQARNFESSCWFKFDWIDRLHL